MLRRLKAKSHGLYNGEKYSPVHAWHRKDETMYFQRDHVTLATEQLCDDCYKLRARGPLPVYQVLDKSSDSCMGLGKRRALQT